MLTVEGDLLLGKSVGGVKFFADRSVCMNRSVCMKVCHEVSIITALQTVLHVYRRNLYISVMKLAKPFYTVGQDAVSLSVTRPVRTQQFTLNEACEAHDHSFYEVTFIWSGQAVHWLASGHVNVTKNWMYVIAPGDIHALSQCKDLHLTNVYYLSEWLLSDLGSLWQEPGLIPLFLASSLFGKTRGLGAQHFLLLEEERSKVKRDLGELEKELSRSQPSQIFMKVITLKLLIQLSRAWFRECGEGFDARFRPEVWKVFERIEASLSGGKAFNVHETAEAQNLSPDYLTKLFREATNCSIEDYYQRRRVQRACVMLLEPKRPITDVAYALNYADGAHFCRLFQKHRGMSPKAYQKMFQG
jgi:AraC family transcriptional regulator, L-rhamnose operon regulatory protein RhaS